MAPVYHLVFLTLLGLCVLLFACWPTRGKGWGGRGLTAIFAAAFVAVLTHQACWQLSGFGSLGFQKFQRRYDTRPTTLARHSEARGRLLDRNGETLAAAIPGKRWGQVAPLGAAGLHTVGYASREFGLSGLVRVYDTRLCGFAEPSRPGDLLRRTRPEDVRTTLDAHLQRVAHDALGDRRGAAIALDPRTGDILALVSSPSADEARLREAMADHANAPLFNRATQGLYPAGSTLKTFTAALALSRRKAGRYVCPPRGWAPAAYTKPIRDTHPHAEDDTLLDLRTAFAESSNIWFAKAATACGWPAFRDALRTCGIDKGFVLARCGERAYVAEPGRLPDLDASPNRVAYLGFGQGDLLMTPLHVAALTAAFANGGVLVPPRLGPGGGGEARRLWPQAVADRVRALMRASVQEGTSRAAALPGVAVCGKTGTAQSSGADHAWFTCFAPYENPQVVVTVLVEHGGFGAATALPIAKTILREALRGKAGER